MPKSKAKAKTKAKAKAKAKAKGQKPKTGTRQSKVPKADKRRVWNEPLTGLSGRGGQWRRADQPRNPNDRLDRPSEHAIRPPPSLWTATLSARDLTTSS
jgi:hypothetical protein